MKASRCGNEGKKVFQRESEKKLTMGLFPVNPKAGALDFYFVRDFHTRDFFIRTCFEGAKRKSVNKSVTQ